jgi:membrane-associated protease RseP (regulator of RpoE activity)
MVALIKRKTLSKISFGCALILLCAVAILYLYNIITWADYPELGFAFRSATGVNVVGVLAEAGQKAGLKMGDRVLMINGKKFTNIKEFRSGVIRKIGEANTYLVERNGLHFEVSITNVPFGLMKSFQRSGLPYLVGLCYVLIGTLVFLMAPHQRASWIFFLFVSTFGLLIAFLFRLSEMRPPWLGTINIFVYSFTAGTLMHLALSFPEERKLITLIQR